MNSRDMEGRVLSIQSHVVSGYVGNKNATFPLQILGFEVDAINSVQFSNHTGYEHFKGQVLGAEQLEELITGLRLNSILHYTHLLTGYIGNVAFLRKIADVARELKSVNPNVIYVCDPVMGDNGQLYVPAELLPIYKQEILPVANIITPNQFEAELLTGRSIKTEADAWEVINILHDCGPSTVILTSSDFASTDVLLGLASSRLSGKKLRLEIPKLTGRFTGTGDLFAACFLAWMSKSNGDIKIAAEKTVSTVQDVLKRTLASAKESSGESGPFTPEVLEMKLIQSKQDIENPRTKFEAVVV